MAVARLGGGNSFANLLAQTGYLMNSKILVEVQVDFLGAVVALKLVFV